ncbi:MAG: protein-glutamate O-methyltransferase family protein [Anaerolineae bacterium]|nr:protein-glutamate O-methyltransferase family protein [Anaerolineae bacterium]
MKRMDIPPPRVDPAMLPPPLMTSEPGSFAHNTFKVRIPRILDDILASDAFPEDIRRAMLDLRAEITGGVIRPLEEKAPDTSFWNEVSRPYFGRSWLDVPWYWAEAYFYRRVLEATRYFQPGPWQGIDPYRGIKRVEWEQDAAPRALAELLRSLPTDPFPRFRRLLYASLWGNRTDLSYNVAAQLGEDARMGDERANLLADDSARVWEHLQARRPGRIAIIADNAGTELLMDLALADSLLCERLAMQVDMHLKAQPFFVSDAMAKDVEAGIEAISLGGRAARQLGERLRGHLREGRLRLRSHWFYTTSLFYFQLPDDLRSELAAADLVILKGDVNYRRLLGDAHWSPTASFEEATAYFPAPLVALRTLKSELIVGLAPGQAERLSVEDPAWMVNGQRGLVQERL